MKYKWIFDTIKVWVYNMYDHNGWEQELIFDSTITKTIMNYKKTLGRGYYIDYIGPGKMHKNDRS